MAAAGPGRRRIRQSPSDRTIRELEGRANPQADRFRRNASTETARGTGPGGQNTLPVLSRHEETGHSSSVGRISPDHVEESPSR
jgi:hypothetical protein